jgi:hypothetical protein
LYAARIITCFDRRPFFDAADDSFECSDGCGDRPEDANVGEELSERSQIDEVVDASLSVPELS